MRPHYSEKLATLRDSRRALVVLLLVTSAMLFSPRSALPKAAAVVQDCNPNAITDGLSDPAALAFDLSGDLWVANAGSNNVVEFKSSPNRVISPIVSKAITNGISSPQVLAFDSLGNLWIANSGSDSIVEYNATSLASPNPSPTKTITSLSFPTGLAIDSAGDLWVSSPQIASILEFNTTSLASNSPTVSKEVGIRAPLSPSGLAFDSRGNLWVSGSTANPPEIWEFDRTSLASSNTTVSKTIGAVEGPFSLTFDSSGTLWVANLGGFIFQFNSTSLKGINPTVSKTLIRIDFLHAFAVDSYGDLWVINGSSSLSDSNAVLEFTPTSLSADTPPFSWKASKTITDGLGFPRGLAFDNSGNLWAVRVISPENSNLMEFNATSLASTRPITSKTVGIPGDSGGLAFDSLGNMWLTSGLDLLEIDRTSLGIAGPTISKTIRAGTNSSYLGRIALDSSGDLWVLNGTGILEYGAASLVDNSPAVLRNIQIGLYPGGLSFDSSGNLWVTASNHSMLYSINSLLEFNATSLLSHNPIPSRTIIDGLDEPAGLIFDSSGNLWVANSDTLSNNVVEFASDCLTGSNPTVSNTISDLSTPLDVAFDLSGNLWVLNWGSNSIVEITITSPPVVQFSYSPSNPSRGQLVSFDARASHQAGGKIASYSWDFGDGHTGYGATTIHAFSLSGTFRVTLTVTALGSATGHTSNDVQVILVEGTPPAPLDYPLYLALSSAALAAIVSVVLVMRRVRKPLPPGLL